MTATPEETPEEGHSYIRGGGGVEVDRRQLVRVLVAIAVAVLAALVVVLAVAAVKSNSRSNRLAQHGVPVVVTVTGCVGLASGTGITAYGYRCTATFTYGGRRYDDLIGGTAALYPPGQTLRAVTDPRNPAILSTAEAVASTPRAWKAFILPAVPLALLVLLLLVVGWRSGRARARPKSGTAGPVGRQEAHARVDPPAPG